MSAFCLRICLDPTEHFFPLRYDHILICCLPVQQFSTSTLFYVADRRGSVRASSRLVFQDKRKVHNPIGLLDVVRESSEFRYWKGEKVIPIGEFLIRYDDMQVTLDIIYLPELPDKPISTDPGVYMILIKSFIYIRSLSHP